MTLFDKKELEGHMERMEHFDKLIILADENDNEEESDKNYELYYAELNKAKKILENIGINGAVAFKMLTQRKEDVLKLCK